MSLRPIAAFALALGVVTCSETGTAPGHAGRAQFALAPQFTARANMAAASGEANFDNVQITITRPPTTTLLDTVVNFAPGQPDVSLKLAVDAQPNEQLLADIQYRNGTTILYEGTVPVTATVDAGTSSTPATPVTVDYVGPGATATRIALSPDSGNVSTSGTLQLTATVTDDTGKVFANTPLGWTSSNDSVATVNATGLVSGAGKRGTATITATTPTGLTASATLHFAPPPSSIAIVGGLGQRGAAGSTLDSALVVEVDGTDSLPVAGQLVSFSATGGHVDADTATTDDKGRAQTHMILSDTVGTAVFMARIGTLTATATETVTPGAPHSLSINSLPVNPAAGTQVSLLAHFVDEFGNAVPQAGSTLTWSGGTGGSYSATSTVTDTTGAAGTQFTLGPKAGMKYELHVTDGTVSGVINVTAAAAGAPAKVVLLDPKSLAPETTPLSFTVVQQANAPDGVPVAQVSDSSGVGIAGASLIFTITSGQTIQLADTITTDTLGRVALLDVDTKQVFQIPGDYTVSLTSAGITTPTTIAVSVVAATVTKISGDNQSGTTGQTLSVQPTVLVTDPHGNPAAGVAVSFVVASGGGHLSDTGAVRTDASGHATAGSWTLGSTVGSQTVTASVFAQSVTFTATATAPAGVATKLGLLGTPPTSTTSGLALSALKVQLYDANGNAVVVGGKAITATVSTGFQVRTGAVESTDAASGAATFGNLRLIGSGSATVTFSADGVQSVPMTVTVNTAPASKLALVNASDTVTFDQGSLPNPIPNVRVTDSTDNPIAGVKVDFAVQVSGTHFAQTIATDSVGTIGLPLSLIQSVPAGTYDLTATGSGLNGGVPLHVTVIVRSLSGATLSIVQQPPSSWVNDTTASTPVTLNLVDGSHNPMSGSTIVATSNRVSGDGAVTLTNNQVTTDAKGNAAFSGLTVLGKVGTFTITFSASGSKAVTATEKITLAPGRAKKMAANGVVTKVQTRGHNKIDSDNLPSVVLTDTSGNAVSGVKPSWAKVQPCYDASVSLGSAATSDTTGVASSPDIGIPTTISGSCGIAAVLAHDGRQDTVSFSVAVVEPSTVVFTGNSKTNRTSWSDPANWNGGKLPGSLDRVMINASVAAKGVPMLDADATIGQLTLESKGSLNLNGHNLTVQGNVDAFTKSSESGRGGGIEGTGTLTLTGPSGSTVGAYMPDANLVVGATACNGTSYSIDDELWTRKTTVNCPLDLSNGVFVSLGSFDTEGSGTIKMTGGAQMIVAPDTGSANALFNGGDESGLITNGSLIFGGDFKQSGNSRSFVSSSSAPVLLYNGTGAAQHVTFSSPSASGSHFGSVYFTNTGHGIVGQSSIYVSDSLFVSDTVAMQTNSTLTAATVLLSDGSVLNGPGLAAFGACYTESSKGAKINILTTTLVSLSCRVNKNLFGTTSDALPTSGALLNRLPTQARLLNSRLTTLRRPAICSALQQLNRVPAQKLQLICPR